jgi:hypothetical protein
VYLRGDRCGFGKVICGIAERKEAECRCRYLPERSKICMCRDGSTLTKRLGEQVSKGVRLLLERLGSTEGPRDNLCNV